MTEIQSTPTPDSPFPYVAHPALNTSLTDEIRSQSQKVYEESRVWSKETRRSEAWKYLPFGESVASEYQDGQYPQDFRWDHIQDPEIGTLTLYTVNGHLCLDKLPKTLPKGIHLFAQSDPHFDHFNLVSDQADPLHPLHALNRAKAHDGWVIYIEPFTRDLPPIWIEHLFSMQTQPIIAHPRLFIYGGQGSVFSVTETFIDHTITDQSCVNALSEIHLEKECNLTYTKVQNQNLNTSHLGTHLFHLEENARCEGIFFNLGSKLTRLDLDAHLKGSNTNLDLKGLFTGSERQVLDQHLTLSHHAPYCHSNQHFKGILNHKAQGIFTGKVYVAPGACGTLAHQNNPNLILDHKARAMTRPQLEIYNDDVECSHGATVGQLDENALFYLKSRGLSHEVAVSMLTMAFASQIQENITSKRINEQCNQAIQRTLRKRGF